MKNVVLALLAAGLLSGAAAAGPYEEAIQALDQGDLTASERLLREAADQGNVTAQTLLGGMYSSGYLQIRRDPAEAVRYYRMAAGRSDREAQYRLALALQSGTGTRPNLVEAYMWYSLAAAAGHPRAANRRDQITTRLSPEQLDTARRRAREWTPDAQ